jgi:8-oxo-dGTP pyrophosphatase MutT (NUDIX family)
MREVTLCLPVLGQPARAVLLGLKKRGFGRGKYVGFGGKIEEGETVAMAAARELQEETGLSVLAEGLDYVATLSFLFPARPDWDHLMHVYLAQTWQGAPTESPEVNPAWFAVERLPLGQMWDDASYWLPQILAGQRLRGTFIYADDNASVQEFSAESL